MKNKKMIWRLLLLAGSILLAGGIFFHYGAKDKTSALDVKTAKVVRGDVAALVVATGTITAANSVEISSRVTGLIKEVRVKENDAVKSGQVLAVLDDSTLRAQVEQYRAQLDNYATIYERSRKLTAVGAQATQQFDADRTNYLVAKANYDNFALQLDYYVITSPIDGIVIGKPTPAGQTVAQGISAPQVIMTIADLARMQIKVSVDESDIGKVRVGQSVSFNVDAYAELSFQGRVSAISKEATVTSNVVYYKVYVDVDETKELLYPGMTARVSIKSGESKAALTIPLTAVREVKGKRCVEVLRGANQETVEIKTGLNDDEKIEVLAGLEEGDTVLLPAAKNKTASERMPGPPPF